MLSKKMIFSSLLVAALAFATLAPKTSFADDGIAKNDDVITQPDNGLDRGATAPTTAPTDGDLAKSDKDNTTTTNPDVSPEPPVVPTTPAENPSSVTDPTAEPTETPKVTEPTSEEKPAVTPNPEDPGTPAVNVNGQPVVTVSPVAPVITAAGQTIVSTQDSQIVVVNTDGTRSLVAPEVAGFTVNADGTLTGKDAKGEDVTLPKTGEESTMLLSMVGSLVVAATTAWAYKKKA